MAINHLAPEQTEQFADNIVGFARALRAAGRDVQGRDPFEFAGEVPKVWDWLQERFPETIGRG